MTITARWVQAHREALGLTIQGLAQISGVPAARIMLLEKLRLVSVGKIARLLRAALEPE